MGRLASLLTTARRTVIGPRQNKSRRRTILFWQRILVLVCVLPAVLVAAFLIVRGYTRERMLLETSTMAMARALSHVVERDLASAVETLQVLAMSPSLASGNLVAFRAEAREALSWQAGSGIVLIDSTGQQVMSTMTVADQPLGHSSVPGLLREIFDTRRPSISDFFVGATTKRPQIAVGVPVMRDGKVIYGLTMGILPNRLSGVLENQHLPANWVAAILDRTGTIFARTHSPDQFIGKKGAPALLMRMAEAPEGTLEANTLEGVDVIAGYSRSAKFGWTVAIGVPAASLISDLRRSLLLNSGVALLFLVLGIGLAEILSRRISRSIRAMTGPALSLGSLDTALAVPRTRIAEVDALGQALIKGSQLIERREHERNKAEESERDMLVAKRSAEAAAAANSQYRLLADHSTDIIVRLGLDGICRYVSPAARHILGRPPEELVGFGISTLAIVDDRAILEEAVTDLRVGVESRLASVRSHGKDGTPIWLEISFQLVRSEETRAPIEIVAIARDISKRQRIQEALSESQARLQSILDNAPVAISLKDREHRYVLLNRQYEKWFGVTREQQLGGTLSDVGTEGEFTALMESLEDRVLATGAVHAVEAKEPDIGTAPSWTLVTKFPVRTESGDVIGIGTVNIDISERHSAAVALQEARDAAVAANQAKSAFLANMSHEIRTPMNGIIGFADLVLDSDLTAEQRERVNFIKDAANSLLAIINDVLDVSKFEAGRLELEHIPMSPKQVLDAAISIVRRDAESKGLALRATLAADMPGWIEGDPTRLRQILLNLLSNAVKFTASGGITVTASRGTNAGDRHLRFAVTDTGIGIPPDLQHLLFQNFSQIDRSITRRFGGTGLGLAICKRLVEAMGGAIGVESEPARGSTFWFTIKLVETTPSGAADTTAADRAWSANILLAEDIGMNQLVIDGLLKAAGHQVTIVANGIEALKAVQARTYDLILMDMEMPGLDGLSATRAIRSLDAPARDIPIIALTANAMPEEIARCKAAGMNDHVAKPIDRDVLLATVGTWRRKQSEPGNAISPANTTTVLDADVLAELERTIGMPKLLEIVGHFRTQLAQSVHVIASATDRGRMASEAHVLISVAGNVGCRQLAELARELTRALKESGDDLAPLVAEIAAAGERALAAMEVRYPQKAAARRS